MRLLMTSCGAARVDWAMRVIPFGVVSSRFRSVAPVRSSERKFRYQILTPVLSPPPVPWAPVFMEGLLFQKGDPHVLEALSHDPLRPLRLARRGSGLRRAGSH